MVPEHNTNRCKKGATFLQSSIYNAIVIFAGVSLGPSAYSDLTAAFWRDCSKHCRRYKLQ